jgi:signal transduction histidine kinase
MYPSIRTTIFWNIFLLMLAAVFLISFVVLRVTGQEILKQRVSAGEGIFFSISTSITQLITGNPSSFHFPSPQSELQQLVAFFAKNPGISQIRVTNDEQIIVADSEEINIGQRAFESDIIQAREMKELVKKIRSAETGQHKQLILCRPLYREKMIPMGALKVIFSLKEADQQIAQSKKMLITYILFDAAILLLFGTWLLSRYLVNPVNKIIRLTEQIARGELDTLVHLTDRNEIGQLSASLSRMAERLNEEKQKVLEQIRILEEKNQQLQQAQQEIIQSEKLASVGRLAAGVAHEIGNPIGIILGYIQLLLTRQLDEQEKTDCLQRMNAETERVNGIIRNLLDYAQPSTEHTEALDLNSIIEETHALVSYQKNYLNIAVSFDLDQSIHPVMGDEKLLRQILINLTLNALDAMQKGGTLAYKTAEEQVAGKTCVSFTLADSGTGIAPENLGKIFDPFFTTKEPGKGTGLGLSNVQRIVDAMGGKIKVSSTPGQGTAFTVLFPVIKT